MTTIENQPVQGLLFYTDIAHVIYFVDMHLELLLVNLVNRVCCQSIFLIHYLFKKSIC